MNRSNEMPRDDSQETAGDKITEESEAQETQQYDKDSDPKYQEVLLNFFRKNANEKEPLFDEIQKIIAEGDVDEIRVFCLSYTDQLSEEAKDYVNTEYTLILMEQKENVRDNFNQEQQTADIKKTETCESLQADLESDPVYQSVVQIFWSKFEEEDNEIEWSMYEKVMLFTHGENNSTKIQDFIDQNIASLSSEARGYLEGKKFIAQTLESKKFE